jgi:hypothetical protein
VLGRQRGYYRSDLSTLSRSRTDWRGSVDGKAASSSPPAYLPIASGKEGRALELLEARNERSLTALQHRYHKVALLIVDELGFVTFDRAGDELLSAR